MAWQANVPYPGIPSVTGNYYLVRIRGDTASAEQVDTGIFASPPSVIYGSDGYPEVLGIGLDGCIWETWLDYWSGGSIVNGPYNTGICGLF